MGVPCFERVCAELNREEPLSVSPSAAVVHSDRFVSLEPNQSQMTASNQAILDILGGANSMLWSPSSKTEAKASEIVSNKVVRCNCCRTPDRSSRPRSAESHFFLQLLVYYSASWCMPCRRFTPILIELYKKLKQRQDVEDFELVFCSMDRTREEYDSYTREMPWWCLPHQSPAMDTLTTLHRAQGIPHLVILDRDGSILVADAVGFVSQDREGTNFPWRPKRLVELFPSSYLPSPGSSSNQNRLATADLDDKYLMLYMSAHWCPPCRRFTPKLAKAYTALKNQRDDFELIFVSSDRDQSSFDQYHSEMTFPAFGFEERQSKADISSRLQIRGIPALIMLGPRPKDGGDRPIINANVRAIFEQGDYLSDFPYRPKPYGDLNKTSDNINELRCVIVFHEGGDDDEQEDIQEALQMAALTDENKNSNLRFLWANSPTGMTKTVREALQLGPIKEEPLMILLDIPDGGSFYVSSSTEVTMDSIQSFIRSPGEKRKL